MHMKTETIHVTSLGLGMDEALAVTEKTGLASGLEKKQILRLRLLAEELIGMLRGIAGDVEADYWLERNGRAYALHLRSDVTMTREMHEQLIAVSTSGENAAAKGFMGKIREMIAVALLPRESGSSLLSGLSGADEHGRAFCRHLPLVHEAIQGSGGRRACGKRGRGGGPGRAGTVHRRNHRRRGERMR